MAKYLSKILVIDIEAICTRYRSDTEIIEVGIAEIDLIKMRIKPAKSWLIKPTRLKINSETINLTGITQKQLDKDGISFRYFCNTVLKNNAAHKKVWWSFGNFDKDAFEKQCKREKIPYPLNRNYYDVQNFIGLISAMKGNDHSNLGLRDALKQNHFSFEGDEHKAKWDAYNTAKLVLKIFKKLKRK